MSSPFPLTHDDSHGARAHIAWGKSAALAWLAPRLRSALLPPFVPVTRTRWRDERQGVLRDCQLRLGAHRFAVRSDAADEDQPGVSSAGRFRTELDVPAAGLAAAIDRVFASLPQPADAVMVQGMVHTPVAGVASTHRIRDGAPWYCIEVADTGTDAVTAGRSRGRQLAVAREALALALDPAQPLESADRAVLAVLQEIETLVPGVPLEIEFAIAPAPGGSVPVLLQVRPLACRARWPRPRTLRIEPLDWLQRADRCAGVYGDRTLLSRMSDWNPVELLGEHPRPLAVSLFTRLIGRDRWWRARQRLGYRAPPGAGLDLLHAVAGRPFVDLRRSANSLLPAGLGAAAGGRLVDGWMQRLLAEPALHDKVEFAVYRTATDFTAAATLRAQWRDPLLATEFAEWEAGLRTLSRAMPRRLQEVLQRGVLGALRDETVDGRDWPVLLARAGAGAEEFAMLARMAFVAEAQLRSAVQRGALHPARAQQLRAAAAATAALYAGDDDAGRWQHLRASSFDITQPVWRGCSERRPPTAPAAPGAFTLQADERRGLTLLLHEAGLGLDADAWLAFVGAATRAREWGKFVFSRHLSAALEGIAAELADLGLEREQASWLSVEQLVGGRRLAAGARRRRWLGIAQLQRERYRRHAAQVLPPLVTTCRDLQVVDGGAAMPNFIGGAVATGPVRVIEQDAAALPLEGCIVVLRNADPGFDWLFARRIAGLVTAWGGAHSHLAIRCAEFGLAAAIGCGEHTFERARRARHAHIDPLTGTLCLQD